jgi:hypothetical protein
MTRQPTQAEVDEALDNAVHNQYDQRWFKDDEIAEDLADNCATFEGVEAAALIPLVADYRRRQWSGPGGE